MHNNDAYIEKAQALVNEQAEKLDRLRTQAEGDATDRSIEQQGHIADLEVKLENARLRLAELADAAEDRWEDVAERFDELASDMGAAFKKFLGKP